LMSTAPPTMVNSTFGENRIFGLNFINRVSPPHSSI
jgi:hypothetical protein